MQQKHQLLLFILLQFSIINATAQVPYISWLHTFGGSEDDRIHQSIVLSESNQYVNLGFTAAFTDSSIISLRDLWLFQADANGHIIWQTLYGGSLEDEGKSFVKTEDDGYLIVGESYSSDGVVPKNEGRADVWALKVDEKGFLLWSKTWGGSQDDRASDVAALGDGQYLVGGVTRSQDGDVSGYIDRQDLWLLCLDEQGDTLWTRIYGGTNNELANALAFDEQTQTVVVAGYTASKDGDVATTKGGRDFWVLRLARNGDLLQEKTFGGSGPDVATEVAIADNGNIIVLGETLSNDGDITENQGEDAWVVCLDEEFNICWQKTLGSTGFEAAQALAIDPAGDVLVALTTVNHPNSTSPFSDTWLFKLDGETGAVIWERIIGGSEDDFSNHIIANELGKYIISGYTDSKNGDLGGGGKQSSFSNKHGAHQAWLYEIQEADVGISTQQLTNNLLKTYFNPSTQTINLSFPPHFFTQYSIANPLVKINLYTANGRLISQKQVDCLANNCQQQMDVAALPNGVYFMETCLSESSCFRDKVLIVR